ncbi:MFS transporter [Actinocrispum wychmicini]|uniref:MFS transporter n=1 Tax=Actinocrispum wychmicini TaxID=1213861 RepID=A0A4R2J7M6_9PSEU|nr:MFS transporter [Actinocrispum wychmicini]TCO55131.1 MFS transporter [Actinocrispum wychmicini]
MALRDCFGREYQVGPAPAALLGRSRESMAWLPWAAMAVTGVSQYAFGSLVPRLTERGWSATGTLWLLAVWTVFQACAGFPTAYLRDRRTRGHSLLGPRTVMVLGAALQVVGLVSLAHFTSLPFALVGYSVLGGTGAGLVYATSTSTVANWHPDRMAARGSFVTGAFAYGAVPFAVAFLFTPVPLALDVTAAVVGIVVAGAGLSFRDPPPNWWPPDVDPRAWATDRRPRPVRQFSFTEALRTGVLPVMYVVLLAASAVSLFTVTFFATLGLSMGVAVVAVGTAILLGANGLGRSMAIQLAERVGRRRAIGAVLAAQAAGQVCLAGAASAHSTVLLLFAAILAGVGGGACYPLFAALAREYFGERDVARTHAVVYSAKAVGGVVGVGLAAFAVPSWGFPGVFLVAATIALTSAILATRLRRPGHVATLPIMYVVDTTTLQGSGGAP